MRRARATSSRQRGGTVAKAAYNLDEKTVKAWKILKDAGEADGIITSEHNVSNLKLYIDAGKTDEQLVKEIKAVGGYEKWAALAKTGGKTVTRTLNAVADAKIIDRVKVLRQKLTSNFKKSGNFGWAEAEVTGLSKSEFYAHSSIDELTGTLPERVPEISLKPKNKIYPSTKEPNIIGEPIDRVVDSEYKILTEITEKLGSNFDATGKITLFTEREPCNSCKNVINLFCKRYPKIEVEVIHNNGKMLIDF